MYHFISFGLKDHGSWPDVVVGYNVPVGESCLNYLSEQNDPLIFSSRQVALSAV